MVDQFVPYELAAKLKELGFDEECLAYYSNKDKYLFFSTIKEIPDEFTLTPLWQQAFDWFSKQHGLFASFSMYTECGWRICTLPNYKTIITSKLEKELYSPKSYKTYEEARQACLEKLIELCNKINKI